MAAMSSSDSGRTGLGLITNSIVGLRQRPAFLRQGVAVQ
jgi:hypothetical protein